MTSSTDYGDYSDSDEFLEAVLGDDEFNFTLEEDGGERLFFDSLFASSIGSTELDLQYETLGRCDVVQEQKDGVRATRYSVDCQHSNSYRGRKRERLLSPRPHKQQGFQMNTVNFDPPAKHVSYIDLSMSSVQSSLEAPSANQQASEESATIQHYSKDQYNEALHNLAESIKRSVVTRRHVMMQHDMLASEQQRALYLAKEQYLKDQEQLLPTPRL